MYEQEVVNNIKKWFSDRGITQNGTQLSQATKMLEEVTEVFDAISTQNKLDLMDGIGDVFVTLVGLAEVSNVDIWSCIDMAYREIKDRKGYLREDGTFVKEEKPKEPVISIEDYNMIADENKCFAEWLKNKGYTNEEINAIAYGEMK